MKPLRTYLMIAGLAAAALAPPIGSLQAQTANLASRPPDAPVSRLPRGPQLLKCELRSLRDGGVRVVITNTLGIVINKGTPYSFSIRAGGAVLSKFEGPAAADIAPNARISEDFQWDIDTCTASVVPRR